VVTDADDDQNKEGVDRDPNEWNRKCHNKKADGQRPENCQEEIQRHQFSCLKEVCVKKGWIDDWWILMEPDFRQEVIAMYQGYEAWTRKKDVIGGIAV